MLKKAYCALLLGASLLAATAAHALDPQRQISQYGHAAWRLSEGAFSGVPLSFAQTTDGYLWIGTETGLLRFDGVRFSSWQLPEGQRLASRQIVSALGDRDGGLWLGTGRELLYWKGGKLSKYSTSIGRVNTLLQDKNGIVWAARSRNADNGQPLCSVSADQSHCYGSDVGIPFGYADPMALDSTGVVWIGSSAGVASWDGKRVSSALPISLAPFAGVQGVSALVGGPGSSLLVGMSHAGPGLGLQVLANGTWSAFQAPGLDGSTLAVSALLVDADHTLWIGTMTDGLLHVRPGGVDRYRAADGLSSDAVSKLFEDREGNIWVATTRGLDCFRDMPVATYSVAEGLTAASIHAITPSADGGLWVSGSGGLYKVRSGVVGLVKATSELPAKALLTALTEDHSGTLWVGIGKALFTFRDNHFTLVDPALDEKGVARVIVEDTDHDIWVATTRKTSVRRYRDRQLVEELPLDPKANVLDMTPKPSGGVWVALTNPAAPRLPLVSVSPGRVAQVLSGGERLRSGSLSADDAGSLWVANLTGLTVARPAEQRILRMPADSLCSGGIYTSIRDLTGGLWLYTQCGVLHASKADIDRWLADPNSQIRWALLDAADGAQTGEPTFSPSVARTADGKLWFITDEALQMVDPVHQRRNRLPPPVQIESLVADGRPFALTPELRLPPLSREIEIAYAALSLTLPQKNRFRYRLEGFEESWHEAGNRRQALYDNLSPGQYRFRVIASNNDAVWNDTGATIAFTLVPAYYQTLWFRALCVLVLALITWFLIALRIRSMTAQIQSRLVERLGERERIARELHDTLLQGFHGLLLRFQVATRMVPAEQRARAALEEALDRADNLLLESRERIRDLRHENGTGMPLSQALANVGEELRQDTGFGLSVNVQGEVCELDPLVGEEVFLIGREALTNAFRHSSGSRVEVEVAYENSGLRLRVRDDGRGIQPELLRTEGLAGHWGLVGMHERAAKIGGGLKVSNLAGRGTEVELKVPAAVVYQASRKPRLMAIVTAWERSLASSLNRMFRM